MPKNDQSRRIVGAMKALLALEDPQQSAKAAWTAWIEQLITDSFSLSPEEYAGIVVRIDPQEALDAQE